MASLAWLVVVDVMIMALLLMVQLLKLQTCQHRWFSTSSSGGNMTLLSCIKLEMGSVWLDVFLHRLLMFAVSVFTSLPLYVFGFFYLVSTILGWDHLEAKMVMSSLVWFLGISSAIFLPSQEPPFLLKSYGRWQW